MAFKTFLSNRDRGLNVHGVEEQPVHKGNVTATAPGSGVYVVNCGGWIKARVGQTGWRVTCDRIGTAGGYDITVGSSVHHSLLDLEAPIDLLIPKAETIRVEQVGMVAGWGPIVVEKVMG